MPSVVEIIEEDENGENFMDRQTDGRTDGQRMDKQTTDNRSSEKLN